MKSSIFIPGNVASPRLTDRIFKENDDLGPQNPKFFWPRGADGHRARKWWKSWGMRQNRGGVTAGTAITRECRASSPAPYSAHSRMRARRLSDRRGWAERCATVLSRSPYNVKLLPERYRSAKGEGESPRGSSSPYGQRGVVGLEEAESFQSAFRVL